ncbi:hypothetical protein AGLY_002678 [Aphis glycines]|uniref:Uncharacterized protein n=1 Tax=Aphis glycines TaxID=307491 RepID=A0A6G0U1C4_APHGL|nr:hypothetical protein AGLY_002678 [Aphis glycines]
MANKLFYNVSVFIFIVTFNDRACDRCVHKLYDPCYRCKKTSYSETPSTSCSRVLITQGMLILSRFVNLKELVQSQLHLPIKVLFKLQYHLFSKSKEFVNGKRQSNDDEVKEQTAKELTGEVYDTVVIILRPNAYKLVILSFNRCRAIIPILHDQLQYKLFRSSIGENFGSLRTACSGHQTFYGGPYLSYVSDWQKKRILMVEIKTLQSARRAAIQYLRTAPCGSTSFSGGNWSVNEV